MNDYIKREDVIQTFIGLSIELNSEDYLHSLMAIESIPSADVVEVVRGEWIITGRTNVYGGQELQCPFCKDRVMVQDIEREHFCRNCGADLRGERGSDE